MYSTGPINVSRTRMQMPAHLEEMASRIGKRPPAKPVSVVNIAKPISTEAQQRLADIEAVLRRKKEQDRRRHLAKIVKFYAKQAKVESDGLFKRGQMRVVMDLFSNVSGITIAQLQSASRSYTLTKPRQRLAWILINFGPWATPEIGRALNRDHSTIVHANQSVNKKPEMKEQAMREYQEIFKLMEK